MAFVNEPENKRTIDYERDAILKGVGNRFKYYRFPADTFILYWQGKEIEIGSVTHIDIPNEDGTGATKKYLIDKCAYPDELKPFKMEIRQMIIEAIETFGVNYGNSKNAKIIVDIHPQVGCLNPDFEPEEPKQ